NYKGVKTKPSQAEGVDLRPKPLQLRRYPQARVEYRTFFGGTASQVGVILPPPRFGEAAHCRSTDTVAAQLVQKFACAPEHWAEAVGNIECIPFSAAVAEPGRPYLAGSRCRH